MKTSIGQRTKEEVTVKMVEDLIPDVFKFSKEAPENPTGFEGLEAFTLTVVGHDYPMKTPQRWNQAAKVLGLTSASIGFFLAGSPKEEELEAILLKVVSTFLRDHRYKGGGVGVGLKEVTARVLQEVGGKIDATSQLVGSVNVIARQEDGSLAGYNTDGEGFVSALKEWLASHGESLTGKRVLVLGTGGTGVPISVFSAQEGAYVVNLNRTAKKATALAERLNEHFGREVAYGGGRDEIRRWMVEEGVDIVVATIDDPTSPLEHYIAFGEIPTHVVQTPTVKDLEENRGDARGILAHLPNQPLVVDVMLRSRMTTTLQEAQAAGLPVMDGSGMFLHQAIKAFWLVHQRELEARGVSREQVAAVVKGVSK